MKCRVKDIGYSHIDKQVIDGNPVKIHANKNKLLRRCNILCDDVRGIFLLSLAVANGYFEERFKATMVLRCTIIKQKLNLTSG